MLPGIEFPSPGRLANTFVYDVTYASSGVDQWPHAAAILVSVPAWYRAVSSPSVDDPLIRATAERQRLRILLSWASLALTRALRRDNLSGRFAVYCSPRLRGVPVLCPLVVRADLDVDDAPVIAIFTPDAD